MECICTYLELKRYILRIKIEIIEKIFYFYDILSSVNRKKDSVYTGALTRIKFFLIGIMNRDNMVL